MIGTRPIVRATRRLLAAPLRLGAAAGTVVVLPLSAYLAAITVAGALSARRTSDGRADRVPDDVLTRFAIMVPAHDEEAVIGRALAAFAALDYPRDRVSVHVVADNCTDRTAALVEEAGFRAHVRVDPDAPGKGHALNWLFGRLDQDPEVGFDVAIVVDADTSVEPDFLRAIDRAMRAGAAVAQGRYGVRDADDQATAMLREAALTCRHHLRPLGRRELGGTCGLYGNGMAFRREVLRERHWSNHLVEDMEMQAELTRDGIRVVYVPDAVLAAEMPDSLDASRTQNERWELGRLQLVRDHLRPVARTAIVGPRGRRLIAADTALDLLVPPLSVMVAADSAATLLAAAAAIVGGSRRDRVVLAGAAASAAVVVGHLATGLWATSGRRGLVRAATALPGYVLWKAGLWVRVLRRPDDVTWTRTQRNADADARGGATE